MFAPTFKASSAKPGKHIRMNGEVNENVFSRCTLNVQLNGTILMRTFDRIINVENVTDTNEIIQ